MTLGYIDSKRAVEFICIFYFWTEAILAQSYHSFQDSDYGEFGLVDESNNRPCLYLKFHAKLYNFNLNGTTIGTELADFTSSSVKLHGFCALHNEVRKHAQIQASWNAGERRRVLKFVFREGYLNPSSSRHQAEELRWLLERLVYSEHFKGKSVSFSSSNESNAIRISAPLNQKFVCKDRLNISLHHQKYEDIIVEFLPEIDVQPVNTKQGFGSNIYVCERTRRRTLKESFQSTMTIFSGFILGLSSVGVLAGYSLRRMFMSPKRTEQQLYNSF
ncbi:UNC-46 protein [Ditylenchus destructor]|nr:UNC-46 protein [Ditylenchus destructor]